MAEKYVLNTTMATELCVELGDAGQAVLCKKEFFSVSADDVEMLVAFLRSTQSIADVRHAYTGPEYILEYDPAHLEPNKFVITRRSTGRKVGMPILATRRLLDALRGYTSYLVREDEQNERMRKALRACHEFFVPYLEPNCSTASEAEIDAMQKLYEQISPLLVEGNARDEPL